MVLEFHTKPFPYWYSFCHMHQGFSSLTDFPFLSNFSQPLSLALFPLQKMLDITSFMLLTVRKLFIRFELEIKQSQV